ncbi:non-specific lipid-transfer protein 2P-like [Triticum dicoccoides]|uniref:non-specific lipid-transfer protein 2P-like n=1 Tax=Triticum dicoccoides TaxID=85692 RepID=UPI000E78F4F0|nr:non-specific lipid-transfer protein 2P-like [Triticum dicoccoides]
MAMRKEVLLVAMMLALVVAAPGGALAACEVGQLTVCMPAITTGAKPSDACCGNLRVQQACFCQYAKDPSLARYITSPHARETLVSCGLAVPHC